MSAPTRPLLVRPIEREDELSLFFWLVRELEPLEVPLEADHRTGRDAAERRTREPGRATVAVVAPPTKTDDAA